MPRIKTYLKNGQVFETVSNLETTKQGEHLLEANWKNIESGERVIHLDLDQIAAITEVIEPKAHK
jgi:transcriptional antiterminator Rof (Rho-off)